MEICWFTPWSDLSDIFTVAELQGYNLWDMETFISSKPLETELKVSATWLRLYSERLELTSAGESHGSP